MIVFRWITWTTVIQYPNDERRDDGHMTTIAYLALSNTLVISNMIHLKNVCFAEKNSCATTNGTWQASRSAHSPAYSVFEHQNNTHPGFHCQRRNAGVQQGHDQDDAVFKEGICDADLD
jgi:hypothetical protein